MKYRYKIDGQWITCRHEFANYWQAYMWISALVGPYKMHDVEIKEIKE